MLVAILSIVPLLAPWLALPVSAAERTFEGSVVCGSPCGAQRASDGRWLLTLVTDALGPPPRPVILDVTDVLRDVPRMEPGDFLSVVVDDVPNALGRYLVRSINKPRDGQETSDRDEQPEPENEDNSPGVTAPIVGDRGSIPTVSLSLTGSPLAEAGGTATVTATLSSPTSAVVRVNLAFDGTATNGADYLPSAGSITIGAGSTTGSVLLTSLQDNLVEPNETIVVAISSAANATVGSPAAVMATIIDVGAPPPGAPNVSLSLTGSPLAESGGVATVTATLSATRPAATTVNLAFGGTATRDTDYAALTTITIPANTLNASMTLTGLGDALVEGNETVIVAIASAPGVGIGSPNTVTAIIADDDAAPGPGAPTVQWTAAAQTVAEGVVAQVTAQLSAATTLDVTVPFTIGGTATPTADFSTNPTPPTPLIIPAGATSASVTVNVVDDGTAEPAETIVFTLGTPTNATRGITFVQTVTISASGETSPIVSTTTPANSSTNVGTQSNVTITFNESVTVTGSWFEIACATSGSRTVASSVVGGGPTTFTIDPSTDFAVGELCTATVFAAQVTDTDLLDPPDAMAANYVFSFTIDAPPAVTTTTPANGATGVPANSNIVVNFTEPVTVTGASFSVVCGAAQAVTVSGSGTSQITLDPTVDLPGSATCTVTVIAAQVTDVDTGDPPDLMTADYAFSFTTVDAAPTVTSTTPANNATTVPIDTTITINFSEPVTYGAGSFTINCGAVQAFSLAGASTSTQAILDPTGDLPGNALCTVTVNASQVTDNDAFDPPNEMAANYVFSFTTSETAPFVTSTTPTNGAASVPNDTNITINFSEPVNFGTGAFAVECPFGTGSVAFTVTGDGSATAVLNPTANLPAGLTCTISVISSQVTDVDTLDPPNTLVPNGSDANGRDAYVFSFSTVDVAPSVTSTTPANGATGVPNDTNITINFNEPVNFSIGSFAIECLFGTGSVAFTVTGSGTATAVLDPTATLPAGVTCTVSVTSSQVTDVDTADPPDTLTPNGENSDGRPAYVFSFTTVDAAPAVTSTTPTNGATNATSDTNITINFSEPVNLGPNAFAIECPFGTGSVAFSVSGTGTSTAVLNPTADLPVGVTCTVSVISSQVTDVDTLDPPNTLVPNGSDANGRDAYLFSFSTVGDAPPSVTGTTPANGATNVPNETNITINFSEPVNFAPNAFTIECPFGSDSAAFTVSGDGTATAVLNPDADLPAGVTCTVSAISARVTDVDTSDPPDTLTPNGENGEGRTAYVFSFSTVDAAPTVTSTTPANGTTTVPIGTNITITFSEPVNFTTGSFSIACPAGSDSVAFTASGDGTSTAVLNPDADLPAGVTCTVSAFSALVTDADTSDPPDGLVPNNEEEEERQSAYVFTFTTAGP